MKKIKLPKGVLKIKTGYNPNSSSIGSVVYTFPLMYIAISAIIAIIALLLKGPQKDK